MQRSQSRTHLSSPSLSNKLEEFRSSLMIKKKEFKVSKIDYFFSNLLEKHNKENYIIIDKDVFYRDVFMFTQSIERIVTTKDVAIHLHLCLREFAQI